MRTNLVLIALTMFSWFAFGEDGINLPGRDYANFNAPSAVTCMNSCAGDLKCQAYTWVKPGIQGPSGRCWLKSAVSPSVKDACCDSGVRHSIPPGYVRAEDKINRPGSDFSDFRMDTWEACQSACGGNSACISWSYLRPGGQRAAGHCWLKNGVAPPVPDANFVSGVKFASSEPEPVKALGRVNTGSTLPTGGEAPICSRAHDARARNSPAAPSLEAQCNVANAQIIANEKAVNAEIAANEKNDLAPGASGVPISICDAAQTALNHAAPEAADLVAKCHASGGGQNLVSEAAQYASSGRTIAEGDALIASGQGQQPAGAARRGFDIGIAVTGSDTAWGPGKQRILDSLTPTEQEGFKVAASFVLDRNRNAQFAKTGAAIAAADPIVQQARIREQDFRYWLGFDIASGVFGDPALGAQGNKATGPGSERIRNGLSAPAQRGYNASTQLHLSRSY
jgi:hypothetical protein